MSDLEIDHEFTARHVTWLVDNGCTGIVTNGSLGEGGTLSLDEKIALWKTCVDAVGDRVPVIAAIASMTTADAITQARQPSAAGCRGLMVLPPYVYRGDWREMKHHITEVVRFDVALVHALQQSGRVRDRLSCPSRSRNSPTRSRICMRSKSRAPTSAA